MTHLAGPGRADQQQALGELSAEPGEARRVFEVRHDLLRRDRTRVIAYSCGTGSA